MPGCDPGVASGRRRGTALHWHGHERPGAAAECGWGVSRWAAAARACAGVRRHRCAPFPLVASWTLRARCSRRHMRCTNGCTRLVTCGEFERQCGDRRPARATGQASAKAGLAGADRHGAHGRAFGRRAAVQPRDCAAAIPVAADGADARVACLGEARDALATGRGGSAAARRGVSRGSDKKYATVADVFRSRHEQHESASRKRAAGGASVDDERRKDEQHVQKVKEAHARIAETLIQSAGEPRLRQQLLDRQPSSRGLMRRKPIATRS